MKHLLEKEGLRVLEGYCFSRPLFAFDYDGTLAEIVDNPESATMTKDVRSAFYSVARFASVAVISGRRRSDVLNYFEKGADFIIGNHGLEGLQDGISSLSRAEVSCRAWLEQLSPLSDITGIFIEDKTYSLSVHYRKSPERIVARSSILEATTALKPSPRIIMGKCVVNLVSPGAPHKGVALLEVMLKANRKSAIYFGDDDNDEDVFRLGEESLLTVRIGKSKESAAMYYVNSPDEVAEALKISSATFIKMGLAPRTIGYLGHKGDNDA